MNRKGFTLIELLAVIVIIGILGVLIVPGLLNNVSTAKEVSYNTLIKNIVISSQTYYEECEYGDLGDKSKYGNYACEIKSDNTITTTLGKLANTGLLDVKDTKVEEGKEVKAVINPKNNIDISNCEIVIQKNVTTTELDENGITNYKVTYSITATGDNCPATSEYQGVS